MGVKEIPHPLRLLDNPGAMLDFCSAVAGLLLVALVFSLGQASLCTFAHALPLA